MVPVRPFGCGSVHGIEVQWVNWPLFRSILFIFSDAHHFSRVQCPISPMPSGQEGCKGCETLKNWWRIQTSLEPRYATEVTWMVLKMSPAGFSPWIFRSQKWKNGKKKAMVKAAMKSSGPSFCCGQALLLKEDIWCYPSPVPWHMTPRPHSGLPRAPAQPWLPSAAKIEALPVPKGGTTMLWEVSTVELQADYKEKKCDPGAKVQSKSSIAWKDPVFVVSIVTHLPAQIHIWLGIYLLVLVPPRWNVARTNPITASSSAIRFCNSSVPGSQACNHNW